MDISSTLRMYQTASAADWQTVERASQAAGQSFLDSFKGMSEAASGSVESDAETERTELLRQLADPGSAFYTEMRLNLRSQMEKAKEDQEEQAIIDVLAKVLDAMSGREDVSGKKTDVTRSAAEMTQKIGERINQLDPDDPERIRLEQMLKQLQAIGVYFPLDGMDDAWEDEEDTFETLTQLLTRRQAEASKHPMENEVNEPA